MKIMSTTGYACMPVKRSGQNAGEEEAKAGRNSRDAKTGTEWDPEEEIKAGLRLFAEPNQGGNGTDSKVQPSKPEDSVGQLASLLARAETDLEVREIQGKVMRALMNLKMAAGLSEGKDKEKLMHQVRRMEKLQKRVLKKLKQLGREAYLERERERAEEKLEEERERELERELKSGRRKRRREEQEYAKRENMEDSQSSENPLSSLSGSGGAGGMIASPVDAQPAVSGDVCAAAAPAEGAFLDVSV
ncbi:MAG: hypothetical protein HFI93_01250 [Lachnospiraceae bacterium]|nr:hypothetical protein [Lachnospiraceae bacterium]